MLTSSRLKDTLNYDASSGVFTWKISPNRKIKAGTIAGCRRAKDGYVIIRIDGVNYYAHRLAWLYMNGKWPDGEIDHKFGDRQNNSISLLRKATPSTNQQNLRSAHRDSSTGLLGVTPHGKKFRAQIQINGKRTYLGVYETPEFAHGAYLARKRRLHSTCTI